MGSEMCIRDSNLPPSCLPRRLPSSVLLRTGSARWVVPFAPPFAILGRKTNKLQFTVRRAFLEDVRALRVRLVLVGLAHVVLLPFLLLFMVVYFFLQNAQEWHSSKVRMVLLLSSSLCFRACFAAISPGAHLGYPRNFAREVPKRRIQQ